MAWGRPGGTKVLPSKHWLPSYGLLQEWDMGVAANVPDAEPLPLLAFVLCVAAGPRLR